MDKYLRRLLYGKRENRVVVHEALGVPMELAVLDPEVQDRPHIAYVDGVLWFWSPTSLSWNAYQLIPLEVLVLETTSDTSYELEDQNMIDLFVFKSVNADLINIGSTPGGSEYIPPGIQLEAGKWKAFQVHIIADGANQTIYFSGFTGASFIKIYKRKLFV